MCASCLQLALFLHDAPVFTLGDCGARLCASFGAGAADGYQATAARLLAATRGDTAVCERYATYLALTRALKGLDLLVDSFERGACASFWPAAGFLFRPPTTRYSTKGKLPVAVFAPVGFEPEAVLRVPPQQLYACLHLLTERFLRAEVARGESGHVLVFDLAQFGWAHLHRRFLTQVVMLVAMLLKNYPEMIAKLHIVNAPAIFSIAWAAILPFANEHVRSKISISRSHDRDALLELVGKEGLPADLGGVLDDAEADGHAAAPADTLPPQPSEAAWAQVEIAAGRTATHAVVVTRDDLERGAAEAAAAAAAAAAVAAAAGGARPTDSPPERGACSLALEFELDGADITFFAVTHALRENDAGGGGGGKSTSGGGASEEKYALEPATLLADEMPCSRLVEVTSPSTVTFVWDNSAAWRYARTVRYRVAKVYGFAQPQGAAGLVTASGTPEWEGLDDAEVAKLVGAAP